MDGDRRAPAAAAASAAEVLGDGDLLREILLCLGFPHHLVHAALVSKRWLLHASDPAFLHRFRDRHPPRLLGFCVRYPGRTYEFVPLPQPPDLAAFSRRAASSCNDAFANSRDQQIKHCRNGRLLIECAADHARCEYSLLAPLLAGEPLAVPSPVPSCCRIYLPDDEGRNGITLARLYNTGRQVRAKVSVLGSGGWGIPTTAFTEIESPYPPPGFIKVLPPVHGKIFVVTNLGYILGLDLTTPHFLIIDLPDGVGGNFLLPSAANSGIYLVNAHEFQISVWLHRMTGDGDGDGVGGWLLVDTFCIRGACARLDSSVPQNGGFVEVVAAGDNADFVFLDYPYSGSVFIVHLRSKVVQKVYQRVQSGHVDRSMINISPVMMIWPPIFPAMDVGHDQED